MKHFDNNHNNNNNSLMISMTTWQLPGSLFQRIPADGTRFVQCLHRQRRVTKHGVSENLFQQNYHLHFSGLLYHWYWRIFVIVKQQNRLWQSSNLKLKYCIDKESTLTNCSSIDFTIRLNFACRFSRLSSCWKDCFSCISTTRDASDRMMLLQIWKYMTFVSFISTYFFRFQILFKSILSIRICFLIWWQGKNDAAPDLEKQ